LVFFSGITDHIVVGLGGSAKHLIGEARAAVANSASGTALFARYLVEELKLSRENAKLYQALKEQTSHRTGKLKADNEEYLGLMALACYTMEGPTEELEFLAKRLLYG
jgi:aromatic ring-opening dioxygenase catalytic subunit (LigB family)